MSSGCACSFDVVLWAGAALQRPLQRLFGPGTPRVQRRREEDLAVTHAVWRGALPPGADGARWRVALRRWLRQAISFRAFYATASVVLARLAALTAVRADHGAAGELAVVLLLAAPVWLALSRGPVRRARWLQEELVGGSLG